MMHVSTTPFVILLVNCKSIFLKTQKNVYLYKMLGLLINTQIWENSLNIYAAL